MIKGHEDFQAANDRPDLLWNIVVKTHVTEKNVHDAHSRRLARLKMEQDFHEMKQRKGETITDFKSRFTDMGHTMIALGVDEPDQTEVALRFLNKLDPGRYARLQLEVRNGVEMGRAPPDTLASMYRVASRREELSRKGGTHSASGGYDVAIVEDAQPKEVRRRVL